MQIFSRFDPHSEDKYLQNKPDISLGKIKENNQEITLKDVIRFKSSKGIGRVIYALELKLQGKGLLTTSKVNKLFEEMKVDKRSEVIDLYINNYRDYKFRAKFENLIKKEKQLPEIQDLLKGENQEVSPSHESVSYETDVMNRIRAQEIAKNEHHPMNEIPDESESEDYEVNVMKRIRNQEMENHLKILTGDKTEQFSEFINEVEERYAQLTSLIKEAEHQLESTSPTHIRLQDKLIVHIYELKLEQAKLEEAFNFEQPFSSENYKTFINSEEAALNLFKAFNDAGTPLLDDGLAGNTLEELEENESVEELKYAFLEKIDVGHLQEQIKQTDINEQNELAYYISILDYKPSGEKFTLETVKELGNQPGDDRIEGFANYLTEKVFEDYTDAGKVNPEKSNAQAKAARALLRIIKY